MTTTAYNFIISVLFATQATALAVWAFVLSRADHDMKLLALGAVISQASQLMATASTVLVGKAVDAKNINVTNKDGGATNVSADAGTPVGE